MGLFDGEIYALSFWAALVICVGLFFFTQRNSSRSTTQAATSGNKGFKRFQREWLVVYLLAFFADWLQGPYVYALYVSYGFDSEAIALLFIMGFMASMVVGTFIGALSDKYGRRNMCIAFSVCYFIAGITKLYNHFWILMVGRFLSGVATSLLFSTFEAWMVSEHNQRGFSESALEETFSFATLGNGMVAVAAGLVAERAADSYGFVAPFVVCLIPLTLVALIVMTSWPENYGDQKVEIVATFTNAWQAIRNDHRVFYLGASQAAYEGAMYTFVFMWTPALATEETKDTMPYGVIFAAFMVCSSIGSSLFRLLSAKVPMESIPLYILAAAFGINFAVAFFIENKALVYILFLAFEITVGMFYPTFGTLRSIYLPEATRAAVMNFFRIPLNAFVVLVLIKVKFMPVATVFYICAAAHGFSCLMYFRFAADVRRQASAVAV